MAYIGNQISLGGATLNYLGTWDASANTPTLTSSLGITGCYYVVSVAGSTGLNEVTDWQVGDWAIFNGFTWQKLDQTNLVSSVAGRTGGIVLTASDIGGVSSVSQGGTGSANIAGAQTNLQVDPAGSAVAMAIALG